MKGINLNFKERECVIASKKGSTRYDLQIGYVKGQASSEMLHRNGAGTARFL